jgi:hypothetical protein
MKPGDSFEVMVSWIIPQTTESITICAVIDPTGVLDPQNRANNKEFVVLVKPDLKVKMVFWEKLSDTDFSITARIINEGTLPSSATKVSFRRDSASGTVLYSQDIGPLNPGQSLDVNFFWNLTEPIQPHYFVSIMVDEDQQVIEFDEGNNNWNLTFGTGEYRLYLPIIFK